MSAEPESATRVRIAAALAELAKGLKGVAFYPPGHPSLAQLMSRIVSLLDAIPLPDAGIEVAVSKGGLLFEGTPLPNPNKTVADFNRDLYVRRVSKLIFLPGLKTDELFTFLAVLGRDPQSLQDDGGLEKILPRENVAHVWVNRVDYASLTEALKHEAMGDVTGDAARAKSLLDSLLGGSEGTGVEPEPATIDELLDRLARETAPAAYRNRVIQLTKMIADERSHRKLEFATRAFSLLARHVGQPPGGFVENADSARRGIKEMATDEMVSHYLFALRDKSRGDRQEAETVLEIFEERAVRPLLDALATENDLLVRKSIVEIVAKIGRPAVPVILENINDAQWYTVRNMLTILGNMGMPDLAPQVANSLAHPDARVKKEAIKALARLDHPFAVSALGELCFHVEESVALTAVAALASKKEAEAVLSLYRRAVRKKMFYPNYRFMQEAIDSLRAIGTDEAVTALGEIIRLRVVWPTKRLRELRVHALQAIGRVGTGRARELLRDFLTDEDEALRVESKRLLRRFEP